jgi:5'-nucleotidase
MRILLTNDDSHDSPLFLLAIRLLRELGELEVVVPAQEQSWRGKSMSRFGELYVDRIDLHGCPAWSVSGTPADCVNLAIYNLLDTPPDIVVSGINIGINTGLGFFMASGTLGACFEANIARLPAIALSQALSREDHREWYSQRTFPPDSLARMERAVTELLPTIWERYARELYAPITWSFNLPDHEEHPEIVHTRLGRTYYRRCFSQRVDQYYHDLQPFEIDDEPGSDQAVVASGKVSATLIDLDVIGQRVPEAGKES